ncbi:MAG: ion transporter [Deltaproteobacteria bacterium]|nr:MAG: ion transporter [Deltaproteobacteria bacterium]
MKLNDLRKKVYKIVEPNKDSSGLSKAFNLFIITVIIINCAAMIFETAGDFYQRNPQLFNIIEVISVLIFSIEYLLRLWSISAAKGYKAWGRVRYMMQPMMIIDLLAILPFYIASIGLDLRAVRILRIFRALRILKLGKYSESMKILGQVFANRKEELSITVLITAILMFISSFVVYLTENTAQPEKFSSIASSIWWAVATLTPGPPAYQFAQPITTLGKIAGGVIQLIGVAIIALPTGILASGFKEELGKKRGKPKLSEDIKNGLEDISLRLEKLEKSMEINHNQLN